MKTREIICFVASCSLSAMALAGSLSDTGQTTCYNTSSISACDADPGFPRQDGSQVSALSYSKLDAGGNELDAATVVWSCVRDNVTGLIWEAKSSDTGLQGVGHRYAWSNPDTTNNGGDAGGTTEAAWCGETLNGQGCTTENYAAAINTLNLCGGADWRLPTQRELLTLLHSGMNKPAIDTAFFPHTAPDVYWTSVTYAPIPAFAWGVNFGYGAANADYKNRPYRVRLVRGASF